MFYKDIELKIWELSLICRISHIEPIMNATLHTIFFFFLSGLISLNVFCFFNTFTTDGIGF